MTTATLSFAELMQQHRSAYMHTLPARLAQLDELTARLGSCADAVPLLPALERLAHSLAGSAGTFGLPALGDTARELELLAEAVRTGDADADALPALVTGVRTRLAQAIDRSQPETRQ